MEIQSVSAQVGTHTLSFEVGRFAQQATSAVVGRYGDTMVLVTVVESAPRADLDYFPLSVEYMEKLYAGGRIKGSRWVKREGRPSDDAILKARVIDRSIRPLFPKSYKNEVQVVVTVLSVDGENDPDMVALNTVSAALSISPLPWKGPVAGMRVGFMQQEQKDGETKPATSFVTNPTFAELEFSELDLIVSQTKQRVVMLEAGANQIGEDTFLSAVEYAKKEAQTVFGMIDELMKKVGKTKNEAAEEEIDKTLLAQVEKEYKKELEALVFQLAAKEGQGEDLPILAKNFAEKNPDYEEKTVLKALDKIFKKTVRRLVMEKDMRADHRKLNEIRPISIEIGVLPRTHGSAVFTRGQTQALTVTTLGIPSLEQYVEKMEGEETKRYMHHYFMPPYSVGETGRIGSPSRREIGHGALAERALIPVLPSDEDFPYAIRVVSEITSSNGSTSMASTCGSTLSLMDAGVPISEPVAGIAMGLMTEGENYKILTDIVGIEDFGGDMDFKVAGTKNGITAVQLDVKIEGLTLPMIKETLERGKEARLFILEKMLAAISVPRTTISRFAPKVKMVQVPVDKIGEVIGPGGRVIRQIMAETSTQLDVSDDGIVSISGVDHESVDKAVAWVEMLTREIKAGEEFEGEVKRILNFGAFVQILPGREGMVHVSQMSQGFVKNATDVVAIGQKVKVKVLEIDQQGRINLTMILDGVKQSPPRNDRPFEHRERSFSRPPFRKPRF
ncbi:MAG: polyribonucleotide nucleotidyltransferase [Patescibacteria group bacterium]|nr:polyribonucleotide nucleotidyltransferase [Patescibacteria group bacterium]